MTHYPCTSPGCDNGRPRDKWICDSCVKAVTKDVARVPELWKDLTATLARQDAIGGDGGRKSSEVGLVFKTSASEARELLAHTVGTWAQEVAQARGERVAGGSTRYLMAHVGTIALLGEGSGRAAGTAVDDIAHAVAYAEKAIDRPEPMVAVGPCNVAGCVERVYAAPGEVEAKCRGCGARHNVAESRQWMIDAALNFEGTATTLRGWVAVLMDQDIPVPTWKSWCQRGKLESTGLDEKGRQLFRFGDVRELAVAWMNRRPWVNPDLIGPADPR